MTRTYDDEPLDEAIARGAHDDDLVAIILAAWLRLPTVDRLELLPRLTPPQKRTTPNAPSDRKPRPD